MSDPVLFDGFEPTPAPAAHQGQDGPLWGKAEPDAMYDAALRRMGQGYALWKKRRPLWT